MGDIGLVYGGSGLLSFPSFLPFLNGDIGPLYGRYRAPLWVIWSTFSTPQLRRHVAQSHIFDFLLLLDLEIKGDPLEDLPLQVCRGVVGAEELFDGLREAGALHCQLVVLRDDALHLYAPHGSSQLLSVTDVSVTVRSSVAR